MKIYLNYIRYCLSGLFILSKLRRFSITVHHDKKVFHTYYTFSTYEDRVDDLLRCIANTRKFSGNMPKDTFANVVNKQLLKILAEESIDAKTN